MIRTLWALGLPLLGACPSWSVTGARGELRFLDPDFHAGPWPFHTGGAALRGTEICPAGWFATADDQGETELSACLNLTAAGGLLPSAGACWILGGDGALAAAVGPSCPAGVADDRFTFEAVEASALSLRWYFEYADIAEQVNRGDDLSITSLDGEPLPVSSLRPPAGASPLLVEGGWAELAIALYDGEAPVAWSTAQHPLSVEGAADLRGPDQHVVTVKAGASAGAVALEGVALAPARWEQVPADRAAAVRILGLRSEGVPFAVHGAVTDQDGAPIFGALLEWSVRSEAPVSLIQREDPSQEGFQPGKVSLDLSCIAPVLEATPREAVFLARLGQRSDQVTVGWIQPASTPEEVARWVSPEHCPQGCGCSSAGPWPPAALLLLPLLLARRRTPPTRAVSSPPARSSP
ncbi:MAG: hypothetical protein JXX28_02375 [Deltaproteobacteria bacterium]|nr:hypothetical protein [Deltaproteobacteria bacterium]